MAGRGSADVEAFFARLPANSLTEHELALRQALLDFVQAEAPRPFPLAEWIDRRIGGEVELRRSPAGRDELLLRGGPDAETKESGGGMGAAAAADPAAEREAFFEGLDPNSFGAQEEALRDAIFEFLARWSSRELATLADLMVDAGVKQRSAFVPESVQLKEWIERRIGEEVQFRPDSKGQDIVEITDKARPVVTAKYTRMAASATAAAATGKGHGPRQQPATKAAPAARAAQPPTAPTPPSGDAFLKSLPENELTSSELALRQALLDFLDKWSRPRGQHGKPAAQPPLLSDLRQDAQVERCRTFLPHTVLLKDWIDQRVGGEIALTPDAKGQIEMSRRGAAPASGRRAPSPKSSKVARAVREREDTGKRRVNASESTEDFIDKLPADRHTDAEADLRQAILEYLEGKGAPVTFADLTRSPLVQQCESAFLPAEASLKAWIDRRIGGEVETFKDESGRPAVKLRESHKASAADAGQDREALKEQFFSTLPQDGFTPDEEQLREALLDILHNWKAKELPTLSHAGSDARVKKYRAKVLARNAAVALRDWIDRRIGGEVELFDTPGGQLAFGFRGAEEAGRKGSAARKRPAGGEPGGRAWKKGGAGGGPPDRSGDHWR